MFLDEEEKAVVKPNAHNVNDVQFSADGSLLAAAVRNRIWIVGILVQQQEIELFDRNDFSKPSIYSVAFSPDAQRVVCGGSDRIIRIWDVASKRILRALYGHEDTIRKVLFSSDGGRLLSVGDDNKVRFWNITDERSISHSKGYEAAVCCIDISSDGKKVVMGSNDDTVRVFEASGKALFVMRGHDAAVHSVAFSGNSQRIVSGSWDDTVRIWDVNSGQEICVLEGHKSEVNCVAFSPNEKLIASGGRDRTVRIWDAEGGKEIMVINGHKGEVTSVLFSKDGMRVISGSTDQTVRYWEVCNGNELSSFTPRPEVNYRIYSVDYSPDEQKLAVCYYEKVVIIDVLSKQEVLEIPRTIRTKNRNHIQFWNNGNYVIIAKKNTIEIWEIASKQCINRLKFPTEIMDFSCHSNGLLVIAFYDSTLQFFQNFGDENNDDWQLHLSTNVENRNLFVDGVKAIPVSGLSFHNHLLLKQRGALVTLKQETVHEQPDREELQESSLSKTKWISAKRAGSPIHQHNNNESKSDNVEDEAKTPKN